MFSRQITRAVWQVFRRAGTRHVRLSLAGPVAFVTVIATWAGLLVLGWALVFWPHMPGSFRFDPGVEAAGSDFVHALNVSLVTLTTLGFGDITPTSEALRLILPLEALLGFGLLSASISWLVSIYPALSRRRSLAYEISLLRVAEAEDDLSLDALTPDAAERLLAELTSRLVAVERDLVHFPISYYFSAGGPAILAAGRRAVPARDRPARDERGAADDRALPLSPADAGDRRSGEDDRRAIPRLRRDHAGGTPARVRSRPPRPRALTLTACASSCSLPTTAAADRAVPVTRHELDTANTPGDPPTVTERTQVPPRPPRREPTALPLPRATEREQTGAGPPVRRDRSRARSPRRRCGRSRRGPPAPES